MSLEAVVGEAKYVSLGLEGYETGVFPRMVLRRADNTLLPESPVDFTAVGSDGQYTAVWTPSEDGDIAGYIVVYEDAGHTQRSGRFEPLPVQFRVWKRNQDENARRTLGYLGENSRVHVTAYSGDDPTASKVYLYDNESDAQNDVNRNGELDVAASPGPLPSTLVRRKIS